jgi:ketosteroid isomerase-like protein
VDAKERVIRELYEARSRRDWDAVRAVFVEDVVWHEPGDEDYSGNHRGRDVVVALLGRLLAVTQGSFRLVPEAVLNAAEHSAVLVRWSAERDGRRSEGNEIAVYRFEGETIAEAWFHPDGYDPAALSAVFAYGD